MRITLVALLMLASGVAAADVSLTGSATHDCTKDGNVSINASGAKVTFTGLCEKISVNGSSNVLTVEKVKKIAVNGSKNQVAVEAADKISVNGSENSVTYKKGLSSPKPVIGGVGMKNTITAR